MVLAYYHSFLLMFIAVYRKVDSMPLLKYGTVPSATLDKMQ